MGEVFTKGTDRALERIPGTTKSYLSADIDVDASENLGCGLAVFDDVDLEWTIDYEEYFFCVEGMVSIATKSDTYELECGDSLWLPNGSWMRFRSTGKATILYVVYPVSAAAAEYERAINDEAS